MADIRRLAPAAVAALLVTVLLAGQAAGDLILPVATHAGAGRLMGRAGFAYLGGIRTFVAAALWARLEPLNDDYYGNVPLGQKKFLLPTVRIVTWLDPQLEEPYYVAPFVLYEGGLKKDARAIAAEGVAKNPDSAFLHASYAQLLLTEEDLPAARREADRALVTKWASEGDEYQLLAPLAVIYRQTGSPEKAALVEAERARLRAKFGPELDAHDDE